MTEKYDFTWPGKSEIKRLANAPAGVNDIKEHDLYGKLAAVYDGDIDLRKLWQYAAHYGGVRKAIYKIIDEINSLKSKDDKVYLTAMLKLALTDNRTAQLWLDGVPIAYRNHKRDKKGKLIEANAYFYQEKTIIEEIQ